MTLAAAFADYLDRRAFVPGRDGEAAQDLAAELAERGLEMDAELLGRHASDPAAGPAPVASGEWSGTRAFVGHQLPEDARPGDLWFDTVEIAPMVLVTGPPDYADFREWLAIRPVAAWQYRAFLELAPVAGRQVQVEPPHRPLDRARIAPGLERAPATRLTEGEASLYAWWFGKVSASLRAWVGARFTLSRPRFDALWSPGLREWVYDRSSVDEGRRIAVWADTIDRDPDKDCVAEERGWEPEPEEQILFGEYTFADDIGMRTGVDAETGLIRQVQGGAMIPEAVALSAVLDRRGV